MMILWSLFCLEAVIFSIHLWSCQFGPIFYYFNVCYSTTLMCCHCTGQTSPPQYTLFLHTQKLYTASSSHWQSNEVHMCTQLCHFPHTVQFKNFTTLLSRHRHSRNMRPEPWDEQFENNLKQWFSTFVWPQTSKFLFIRWGPSPNKFQDPVLGYGPAVEKYWSRMWLPGVGEARICPFREAHVQAPTPSSGHTHYITI
jgi:hypothetical protein